MKKQAIFAVDRGHGRRADHGRSTSVGKNTDVFSLLAMVVVIAILAFFVIRYVSRKWVKAPFFKICHASIFELLRDILSA